MNTFPRDRQPTDYSVEALSGCGKSVDRFGECHVEAGRAPGTVGGDGDVHPVPRVGPVGMVLKLLGDGGHLSHEGERRGEIDEREGPTEVLALEHPFW